MKSRLPLFGLVLFLVLVASTAHAGPCSITSPQSCSIMAVTGGIGNAVQDSSTVPASFTAAAESVMEDYTGPDPSISATSAIPNVPGEGCAVTTQPCGGDLQAYLEYQLVVLGPSGDSSPQSVNLDVRSSVNLNLGNPGAMGDAWLEIYDGSGIAYEQEDCGQGELASNCRDGLGPVTIAQLANTAVTMNINTTYTVFMEITINPGVIGGGISATLDPEFFLPPDTGETIDYSPGITQAQESGAAPQPASLSLMGAGFSALLCFRRKWQTRS